MKVCASTPTLSPLSPPSPALVAGEDRSGSDPCGHTTRALVHGIPQKGLRIAFRVLGFGLSVFRV